MSRNLDWGPRLNFNQKTFQSSNLNQGSYDPSSLTLTINFVSGRTYEYYQVPGEAWSRLRSASDADGYFRAYIVPMFRSRKVG